MTMDEIRAYLPRVKTWNIQRNDHPWGYAIISQSYNLDATEITINRNDGTEVAYIRHNGLLSEEMAHDVIMQYLVTTEAFYD